jgi:hypothetical protein
MFRRRIEIARTFTALGWQQTETQQVLALAMETRGELRSILLGAPDADIDRVPAPGEWTVRQTLEHAHAVDGRYASAIEYAVERVHSSVELPLQRPRAATSEPAGDTRLGGSLGQVLTQLHLTRDDVVARLNGIADADLQAPAIYGGHEVDVRYRLHLLSSHEREHAGQVARTLRDIGFRQTEAQMILGHAEVARGHIEGMLIGIPDALLTRVPSGGIPTVQQILEIAVEEEDGLARAIVDAAA